MPTPEGYLKVPFGREVVGAELQWISKTFSDPPYLEPCSGVLRPLRVKGVDGVWCDRCRRRGSGSLIGIPCPRRVPPSDIIGTRGTIWPGTDAVSKFGRWAGRCNNSRKRVCVIGEPGSSDRRHLQQRAEFFHVADFAAILRTPEGDWPRIAEASGGFDLVVVYLIAFPLQARAFDLLNPGGVLRSAFDLEVDGQVEGIERGYKVHIPGFGDARHYYRKESEA